MLTTDLKSAEECGERVRTIRTALFGDTLGNAYKTHLRSHRDGIVKMARRTHGAMLAAILDDNDLAPLTIAALTRKRDHASIMFLALDMANHSLMNPQMVKVTTLDDYLDCVNRNFDNPVPLILGCVKPLMGAD